MINNYEEFLNYLKPRYGFLNLKKRNYNDSTLAARLRASNFINFTKEQTENVLKILKEKNESLLREVNIKTMKYVMNGEIDLRNYSFSMEEITNIFMYEKDYGLIPEYVKKNNEKITKENIRDEKVFELREELIKNCPSLTNEINMKTFYVVYNDYKNYENKLGNYQEEFIKILKNEKKYYDAFLENIINLNYNQKPYYNLYKSKLIFLESYFLKNIDTINKENYKDIPYEILEKVLYSYLDINFDNDIADELFTKLPVYSEKINNKILQLYMDKKIVLKKSSLKKLISNYPIALIKTDINNLKLLTDFLKESDSYSSTFANAYAKEFPELINICIKNNIKINKVFTNIFVHALEHPINANDISNILKQVLDNNLLDKDFINALAKKAKDFNKKDIKSLYDYCKNNNLETDYKALSYYINTDNYNVNLVVLEEDIRININDKNKEKAIKFIKELKNYKYQKNIILIMDTIDRDYLIKTKELLPNQIKVFPKRNQDIEKSSRTYYEIDDILEKDRILQLHADSVKKVKSKTGKIKELSPFEKFIAAYLMTTRFLKYTKEDESTENDFSNYHISRSVYEFVNSKDPRIVCVGYSNLLIEYLDRMGLKGMAEKISLSNTKDFRSGHAVVVVHIDDPKYGIKGTFISDPTNDAVEDNSLSHSNDLNGVLIPVDQYFKDNPQFKNLNQEKQSSLLMDNEMVNNTQPLNKSKLVYALLAIRHFVDKNMEMIEENTIGENGYTKKEFNDMAASYKATETAIINKNDYIKTYLVRPLRKTLRDFYYTPDNTKKVIRNFVENIIAKSLKLDILYVSLDNSFRDVIINVDMDLNIDLSNTKDENIQKIKSICDIYMTDGFSFGGKYNLIFKFIPQQTLLQNLRRVKKGYNEVKKILMNYKKESQENNKKRI